MFVAELLKGARRQVHDTSKALSWFPPLLVRVVVGWFLLSPGSWNDDAEHLGPSAALFMDLRVPLAIGGALLIAGLFSRLVSLALAAVMVAALVQSKAEAFASLPSLFGQVELTYAAMLAVVVFVGPGPVALDRVLLGWASALGRSRSPSG